MRPNDKLRGEYANRKYPSAGCSMPAATTSPTQEHYQVTFEYVMLDRGERQRDAGTRAG